MSTYVPDTNVLIDFGLNEAVRTKLENARQNGSIFLIAPPALIELVRGVIAGGSDRFEDNKRVFVWIQTQRFTILELPRPFMAKILRTSSQRVSGVVPEHYRILIDMIVCSTDFGDFLKRSEAPSNVWRDISRLGEIHESELDREFRAFEKLAKRARSQDIASKLSQTFGAPGCRPNPLILEQRFSAAIEFLESSLRKIADGSKPRKNDSGLYFDFQLFLYLAVPEINFLTSEKFSSDIKRSPQRFRIIGLDSLN